jgi:hypothetical protein
MKVKIGWKNVSSKMHSRIKKGNSMSPFSGF